MSGAEHGPEHRRGRVVRFVADVGGVVAFWMVMFLIENVVVGVGWREQFAGSWEMAHARYYLTPIAVATTLPLAVVLVALGRVVARRDARVAGSVAGGVGLVVALGVSGGRHMTSLLGRGVFVAVVTVAAIAATALFVRRAPLDRPRMLAAMGLAVSIAAWIVNGTVLPRLYPAFHAALLGISLAGWAATFLIARGERPWRPLWFVALSAAVLATAWTPRAARAVVGDDNLRRVLVEHAPVLGHAVLVASELAPPPPIDDDSDHLARATAAVVHPKALARSLDWTGKDIVVITIDALRADHVSSYGYAQKTTPNIDRLAERGVRFEHAYCPTPHTSYSVTSMMTGKYMRPLLAMGAGDDSETWADYLRRYGFRTAAFYPPAVFFIDEHRFGRMKAEGLGFEYRKEEFAAPELRRAQIAEYVATAPKDKPLFLWVHLFEPHEPYVMHPEHRFDVAAGLDAYDSEVATADDEVGMIVDVVEKRRPGAVVVVSADHGEEFGDHGGRYHGTTVYEEQVRVPLVVVAPGIAPNVVKTPVQTIDLLPTALAALDVPLPARLRGRDLGALLAGKAPANEEGLAFAETDDYTLVARGDERLVCLRKIASCTLFDVRTDPLEKKPIGDRPARVRELRKLTAAIERENGKLEANALPEALRRGLQGDRDAAEDVAALFDDARVDIRREAARCAFRLKAPVMEPQLRRALAKDEDAEVKKWCAVALLRLGAGADAGTGTETGTDALLRDGEPRFRLAAALALAEQGDARGESELVARWERAFGPGAREHGELEEAREILAAFAKVHAKSPVPLLARSLDDVRLRSYVVDALADIGDARAIPALVATFTNERYVDVRPKEARAILRLGGRDVLLPPLRRFAGTPAPMPEAFDIARDAGLLAPAQGGWIASGAASRPEVDVQLHLDGSGAARLLVMAAGDGAVSATVDDSAVHLSQQGPVWTSELARAELASVGPRVRIRASSPTGITAIWLVRRAEDVPPPAPREWLPADAGPDAARNGDAAADGGASGAAKGGL